MKLTPPTEPTPTPYQMTSGVMAMYEQGFTIARIANLMRKSHSEVWRMIMCSTPIHLGHKSEPYYDSEVLPEPQYTVDQLSPQERLICDSLGSVEPMYSHDKRVVGSKTNFAERYKNIRLSKQTI